VVPRRVPAEIAVRGALRAVALLLPIAAFAASLSPHAQRQAEDRARAGVPFGTLGVEKPPAALAFSERCIFEALMRRRNRTIDPSKPLPPILLESRTPLARFQDAIEAQWGQRPEMFSNAYSLKTGEIFLIDDAGYYDRLRRVIDDSLAHELTHYIQVVYERGDLMNDPMGSYEEDAIDAQTWFRADVYPKGPASCQP
jgi:hypothetical protein